MSEVWVDLATKFGVPTAIGAFALYGYYKLSSETINQSVHREEVQRVDSKERETQMRETIRLFSSSVAKMDETLNTMNTNMTKINKNLDINNKIIEKICNGTNIKVITPSENGN